MKHENRNKMFHNSKTKTQNKILRSKNTEPESQAKERLEDDGWTFPAVYKFIKDKNIFVIP